MKSFSLEIHDVANSFKIKGWIEFSESYSDDKIYQSIYVSLYNNLHLQGVPKKGVLGKTRKISCISTIHIQKNKILSHITKKFKAR